MFYYLEAIANKFQHVALQEFTNMYKYVAICFALKPCSFLDCLMGCLRLFNQYYFSVVFLIKNLFVNKTLTAKVHLCSAFQVFLFHLTALLCYKTSKSTPVKLNTLFALDT